MRLGGRCVDGHERAEAGANQHHGSRRRREMAAAVCSSILVVVSVSNAGWLKSGHENPTPCAANSRSKRWAFDEAGDEANPWR